MSRIRLATEFADKVKQSLVDHMTKDRRESDDKFHVSDLLAPRFAFYAIGDGRVMRPEDVDMFIPGVAFHELLQKAMGTEYAEKVVELEDIVGHIDLLMSYVVEIKTSRKYTIPEMPDAHYLQQAKYYMALSDKKIGYIVVIYFTAGRNPWKKKASTLEIVAWKIEMSQEELEKTRGEMLNIRNSIKEAVVINKPEILPLCQIWKCGQAYKGEITRSCPYYSQCKPEGRFPESVLLRGLK